MLRLTLLLLAALLCCGPVRVINATSYTMFVNDQQIQDSNGFISAYASVASSEIKISCRINPFNSDATMDLVTTSGRATSLYPLVSDSVSGQDRFLNYSRPASTPGRSAETYRCREKTSASCPAYVQVTLYFSSSQPNTAPTIATNCQPGGHAPSTIPSSGGTNSPKFAGLNPLIYTISAVILLGTLAIVAIITCWIRARRSYNRRMFQANTDPQDYLDYISDNEFTPLTTSEFVASLQERPPTYHESEEIEGQNRDGNEGAESSEGDNSGGTGGTSTTPASAGTSTGRSTGSTRTTGSSRTPPSRPPPPTNSTTPRARPQTTPTNRVGVSGTQPDRWNDPGVGGVEEAVLVRTSPSPISDTAQSQEATGTTQASATSHDITGGTGEQAATGVSSSEPILGGVDALLSLDVGTMEVTQPWSLEPRPPPSSSSNEPSTAVGTLIDLDLGPSPDSGLLAVSDSQSAFQTLPQPTPEQISEIEAAIGAINKHMTEIRERTE